MTPPAPPPATSGRGPAGEQAPPDRVPEGYEDELGLHLDPFQRRAIGSVATGRSVLVSAPTGSGKTVVADFAAWRALGRGRKLFYTTPIKALSNQKYRELVARFGEARVGLLTGDVSHRALAPLVVMTTEVLRNMLLAGSPVLDGLDAVVLDEVHYLADPARGSVWEEVIVLTPPTVGFVCLSATVHNAAELGAWLESVRGPTDVVVADERPVALEHHVAVARRAREGVTLVPLVAGGRVSPQAAVLDRGRGRGPSARWRVPRRSEVVEVLADATMLPAIVFLFSRAGCEEAARACVEDGLRLTRPSARRRLRAIAEANVEHLSDDDLATLGYGRWLDTLEAGFAPHHAGMVPAFRHAVEQCFGEGLLPVVFATETLAVGINMPARTVVIDRFTKFRGATRTALHAGELRQLTGRAGRRGIDTVGHAVLRWSPQTATAAMAATVLAPPPDLVSSFHPTYNLCVNLVHRWSRADALALLASSFGQWQAPPGSLSLVAQLDRRLSVLGTLGYVDGWALTAGGRLLMGISHECDLLVAESLRRGVLVGLTPAQLAAAASALVHEERRERDGEVGRVPQPVAAALAGLDALAATVRGRERGVGLPRTRKPDGALARATLSWASGRPLSVALGEADVAPGDFVRTARQLVDLLRQIALVGGGDGVDAAAARAASLLARGVVAAEDPTRAAGVAAGPSGGVAGVAGAARLTAADAPPGPAEAPEPGASGSGEVGSGAAHGRAGRPPRGSAPGG